MHKDVVHLAPPLYHTTPHNPIPPTHPDVVMRWEWLKHHTPTHNPIPPTHPDVVMRGEWLKYGYKEVDDVLISAILALEEEVLVMEDYLTIHVLHHDPECLWEGWEIIGGGGRREGGEWEERKRRRRTKEIGRGRRVGGEEEMRREEEGRKNEEVKEGGGGAGVEKRDKPTSEVP